MLVHRQRTLIIYLRQISKSLNLPEFFRKRDNKVLFYTGLPSNEILNFVFELVLPSVSRPSQSLSPFQELVMVLINIR